MKKAFAIFCAVILMPGLNAQAWVGGPFSNNNSLSTGDDGVYEAVATATNGTGLYRWGVRNNGTGAQTTPTGAEALTGSVSNIQFNAGILGAISSNVWYYQGITYYGRTFGTVNSAMGVVSVIANASELGNEPLINNIPVTPNIGGNTGLTVAIAGDDTVLVTARPQPYPGTANSSFTARINPAGNHDPVKRFWGDGVISFNRETDSIRLISFRIDDVGTDVTIDGSATSGADSTDFEEQGHVVKFKVTGSQVSTLVFP